MRQLLINSQAKELSKFNVSEDIIVSLQIKNFMSKGRFLVINESLYNKYAIDLIELCRLNKYEVTREYIKFNSIDLSHYKKIITFGDIHGNYSVFIDAYNKLVDEDTFVIFTGDYINRGKENVEMINFLYQIKDNKNVVLIEGNHDKFLWDYVNDGKLLENVKFKKLEEEIRLSGYPKKNIKELSMKLKEVFRFTYMGKEYFVSHGGLPFYPTNFELLNSEKYLVGLGNDYIKIDKAFDEEYENSNLYQIHGHSNLYSIVPDMYKHSINLEGGVEIGGNLVAYEITKEYSKPHLFKSPNSIMLNFFD